MLISLILACGTPTALTGPTPGVSTPVDSITGFQPSGDGFVANHSPMGSTTTVTDTGIQYAGTDWELLLRPVSMSRDSTSTPIDISGPQLIGDRVEAGLDPVFWATHDEQGLEFGFDLQTRPQGEGNLVIRLDYAGQDMPYGFGTDISFDTGSALVHIDGLHVVDAEGAILRSWMGVQCDPSSEELDELVDCHVALEIDDDGALYPLVVDPLVTTSPRIVSPRSILATDPLVITEMMIHPRLVSDTRGEWFEIVNTGSTTVDLADLAMWDDGSNYHKLPSTTLLLAAGETFVMGRNGSFGINGGVPVDYDYSGMAFNNISSASASDELIIGIRASSAPCDPMSNPCTEIDRVEWDASWRHVVPGLTDFMPDGATLQLDPTLFTGDNNLRSSWCEGFTPYGTGQFGSPGVENESCSFTLPFEFEFELVGGGTAGACTNIHPLLGGTMSTNNSGDGSYQRYTRGSGQTLTWTYDYLGTPPAMPTRYEGLRTFGAPTWNTGDITNFDMGIASSGSWLSPCVPVDTGDTSDTSVPPSGSLMITQYIEGASNDKYLELQNRGTADQDMADCFVDIYFNGNTFFGQHIPLSAAGTLAVGDTYVLCHNMAPPPVPGTVCDEYTGNLEFNGNDAIDISCDNITSDSLGEIGDDPGSGGWGVSPLDTNNANLSRVCSDPADTNAFNNYTTAGRWTLNGTLSDLSDLGTGCP